jgi:Na+-driven multidrug efflux pump
MVLSSLINILLDCLFVFGFGWGVESAAAATVIAQASSFIFCLFRIKSVEFMRLSREDLMPVRARGLRLMRLGAPISAQNAVIAIGGMIVQTVVNGMGVSFIAGYTATNKLYGLLEIAAVSYGYAISTYAGQNLGAKRMERVRDGVRAGLKSGIITALGIALIMVLFGKSILSLFIGESETDALDMAVEYLTIMAGCLPILYVLYVYRSALQGMGNTVMPMVSGIAEFVMRTGSALLLPGLIGYTGLFWAEVLAWLGADVILIPSYYRMYRHASKQAV